MAESKMWAFLGLVAALLIGILSQLREFEHFRATFISPFDSSAVQHLSFNADADETLSRSEIIEGSPSSGDSVDELEETSSRDSTTVPGESETMQESASFSEDSSGPPNESKVEESRRMCSSCEPGNVKTIYTRIRFDRSGATIFNMLAAHAFTRSSGYQYGGACDSSSYMDDHREMISALGLEDELKFETCDNMNENECLLNTTLNRRCVRQAYTENMTPEWRASLQSKVYRAVKPDEPIKGLNFTIAVHIRRGDVDPCNQRGRYLPNQHYIDIIDQVYKEAGAAGGTIVKIYSEEDAWESFDEFKDRGAYLFLSGSRAEVWRGILNADVAILSRSSFSYAPAALTKARVIYTPGGEVPPLSYWEVVDDAILQRTVATTKSRTKICRLQARANQTSINATTKMMPNAATGVESDVSVQQAKKSQTRSNTVAETMPPIHTKSRIERNITSEVKSIQNRLSKAKRGRVLRVCKSCQLEESSIYSLMRYDRSGAAVFNMLAVNAFAFSQGRAFGGACVKKKTIHRLAGNMEMVNSLGLQEDLPFSACDDMEEGECMLASEMNRDCVRSNYTGLMTAEWRRHLESKVYDVISPDESGNYTIAVHIRRGDVDPCAYSNRYLPNQHYMDIIDQVYKPGAVVKIYSEEESYESFDEFRDRGFHLFLSESREEVWRGILNADVVILSRSSFSFVPAALTKARVICTPGGEVTPLSYWEIVDDGVLKRTKEWFDKAAIQCRLERAAKAANTSVVT